MYRDALFLFAVFLLQDPTIQLKLGEKLQATIESSSAIAETETLRKNYKDAPVRGKTLSLQVQESGKYHIILRSYDFDAYLVLRDQAGTPIAEDDDGFLATHSQVEANLEKGMRYSVQACALHGEFGSFSLETLPGDATVSSAEEKAKLEYQDIQEGVQKVKSGAAQGSPTFLNTAARTLEAYGNISESLNLFQLAVKRREAIVGPDDPSLLNDLAFIGGSLSRQGKYDEANVVFERSLKIAEKAFGPSHETTYKMTMQLAAGYLFRGENTKARGILEPLIKGPNIFKDPVNQLGLELTYGRVLMDMSEYEEAKPYLENVFAKCEKLFGSNHRNTAAAAGNLSGLYSKMGDYEKAAQLQEKTLKILEQSLGGEHEELAVSLNNLSNIYLRQGRNHESRLLLERAAKIQEKTIGSTSPTFAVTQMNIGSRLTGEGDYAGAYQVLQRALKIFVSNFGDNYEWSALTLHNIAFNFSDSGKFEEARPYYARALAAHENIYGKEHPQTAGMLSAIARSYLVEGEFAKAKELLERVLKIRERYPSLSPLETNIVLQAMGTALQGLGEYKESQKYYERAVKIGENILGSDHPDALGSHCNLAVCLYYNEQIPEAWRKQERVVAGYEKYIQAQFWGLSESERLSIAASQRHFISTLLSLDHALSDPVQEETTYSHLLWWKGHVSRSLFATKERLLSNVTDEQKQKLKTLQGLQAQISNLFFAEGMDAAQQQAKLDQLKKKGNEIERELSRLAGEEKRSWTWSIKDLVKALPPGAALVDFYSFPDFSLKKNYQKPELDEDVLMAWVIRKDDGKLRRVYLGPTAKIEAANRAFLSSVSTKAAGATPKIDSKASTEMRQLFWEPLQKNLAGVETVFVSPDGFLGTIPLETISLTDGSYLIEHFNFVYLQDMARLMEMAPKTAQLHRGSLLAIGGVNYQTKATLSEESLTAVASAKGEQRGSYRTSWPELPSTLQEAEVVHRYHQTQNKDFDRLLLKDQAALEERLKLEMPRYQFLHIATHGYFQPDGLTSSWENAQTKNRNLSASELQRSSIFFTGALPGFLSGLVCAGANQPAKENEDNGLLTAEEVSWLDLSHCDLAVLSACQTGLGTVRGGEGMIGLRRSFIQAGAKTVISSLWSIGDDSTKELMQEFYRRLWVEGKGKKEALRGAQLEMLRRQREKFNGASFPYAWGAFVLDGDWR